MVRGLAVLLLATPLLALAMNAPARAWPEPTALLPTASFADSDERIGISLDAASDMVQRQFNARVVRAEVRRDDGRTWYRFKLLSDSGRVFSVSVDAASGEIL
jgi:Peptidase propeptide and YPEB domain